ncbi:O-antigen ligase family protein [Glycocaulis sp.]|uniref:O-antigen ligase family protein n=1 Tax=Glycocaulis sp. TaxID=1969725 RepID=UPI003F70F035
MHQDTHTGLQLLFPAGLLLALIGAAAVFFGADIPAAKAYFSSAILLVAALGVLCLDTQRPTPGIWIGVAGLGALAILLVARGHVDTGGPDFGAIAAAGALWLVARNSARISGGAVWVWRASLAAGVIIAIWSFLDFTLSPDHLWGVERPYHRDRLSGGFLSANTAATYFGLISLMGLTELLAWIRRASTRDQGVSRHAIALSLALVATLLPATCLVLTASRAGIAFTGFAALLLTGWQIYAWSRQSNAAHRSLGLAVGSGAAFLVLAGLVWTVSGELAASRFDRVFDDTSRQTLFAAYWQAVPLAPLWGHGLGSFGFVNDLIATSRNAAILGNQGAAHNVYLQWLLQMGWAGTLAMAAVIAALVMAVMRGLRRRRKEQVYLRAVICISILVLLHALTDYALEVPGFMWWWAWVLGLGCAVGAGGRAARQGDVRRRAQLGLLARWAPRAGLSVLALGLAGALGWQGQLRLEANAAYRLGPEAIAQIAARDALAPSAYWREAIASRAIEADIHDLDFAERATRGALEREPRLVTAWNRLVYIDMARHGRLTPDGQEALAQSFYLSPYGARDIMRWRLQITALAWAELDEGIRRQALSQALVLVGRRADRRWLQNFGEDAPADMRAALEELLGGSL